MTDFANLTHFIDIIILFHMGPITQKLIISPVFKVHRILGVRYAVKLELIGYAAVAICAAKPGDL